MGTYDDRLTRVVAEFGQAVQEYTAVAGGESVDESPELAALEKRVRDTGWQFLPGLYVWAWSRMQYDDPDMEKDMEQIGEVLVRVSSALVRHRDRISEQTTRVNGLKAEVADLRKRVRRLEAAMVRNIPAPLPAAFDVPDWNAGGESVDESDMQARIVITMLIGELRNRFAAPVPVAGGGE